MASKGVQIGVLLSRSTTADAQFGQGLKMDRSNFQVSKWDVTGSTPRHLTLFHFVYILNFCNGHSTENIFLINFLMSDYDINWEPGKMTDSWDTMYDVFSLFQLISWPLINEVIKNILHWMAIAEIRGKNEKIDMAGSRARCIPLQKPEIDAAHLHSPVRNYHTPSSAGQQYTYLNPFAPPWDRPSLNLDAALTQGRCFVS